MCGASGRVWHRSPEVFQCPNCATIYSEFGFVTEPDMEYESSMWS
jgi:hypothetical protein